VRFEPFGRIRTDILEAARKRRSAMATNSLTRAQLDQLARLESSAVANAIEIFDVRLRNTGFTDSSVRCMFPDFPVMVGYAATARVRTADPPMGSHSYYDRTDWWNHILSIPSPRIVVVEDVDQHPGLGAFIGEVHANILNALGCAGVVTNGAVRGLRAVRAARFQMFAGGTSVSHAYAHVFDFGGAVTIGRMKVQSGDLLHGDAHGVQTVPLEIADKVADVAKEILQNKKRLAALCHSREFTLDKIRAAVKDWKP
jgi:4-hydroxy-4-methyl-2-oxoglutarate aldolase